MFSIYCVRDVWLPKAGPESTESVWRIDLASAITEAKASPVDRVELLSTTVYEIMLHEPTNPAALVYALNHPRDWKMIYRNSGREV